MQNKLIFTLGNPSNIRLPSQTICIRFILYFFQLSFQSGQFRISYFLEEIYQRRVHLAPLIVTQLVCFLMFYQFSGGPPSAAQVNVEDEKPYERNGDQTHNNRAYNNNNSCINLRACSVHGKDDAVEDKSAYCQSHAGEK